jgi:hypothetical protein
MEVHQVSIKVKGDISDIIYARRVSTVCILPGQVFTKATRKRINNILREVSEICGEVCYAHFRIGGLSHVVLED